MMDIVMVLMGMAAGATIATVIGYRRLSRRIDAEYIAAIDRHYRHS